MNKKKDSAQSAKRWLNIWQHKWVKRAAVAVCSLAFLLIFIQILNTFVFLPIKNPDYGVSFSLKRAIELNLDWKANFLALVDDLKFRRLRLMSYWDVYEQDRSKFNFETLDWQMDEAAKRGVKVSLVTGLRQPRWPECHEPEWAKQLGGNRWKQALYAYIEVVVNRYKNHPALDTWQLENEGLNNWFGACQTPDRPRLKEELALLKRLDPKHKVIMSLSDQHTIPLAGPVPDEYGFSVYRIVWNDKIPPAGYIYYPTPIWYHRLRAQIIKFMYHRPIMIHELQMEPWGPVDTKLLSREEQDKSMSTSQIAKSFKFARQLDIKRIDLWGGEWWYWRKSNGDANIWEAVRYQLENSK